MEHSRTQHPELPAPVPTLTVTYTPLQDAVAVLDTSDSDWVMHLDVDSPAEDHIWALLEAVAILSQRADPAATAAVGHRHLRLVPPPATPTR